MHKKRQSNQAVKEQLEGWLHRASNSQPPRRHAMRHLNPCSRGTKKRRTFMTEASSCVMAGDRSSRTESGSGNLAEPPGPSSAIASADSALGEGGGAGGQH